MAQLVFLIFIIVFAEIGFAAEVTVAPQILHEGDFKFSMIAHWSMPTELKYKKVRVGGLSACSIDHETMYAISDDRGKFAEPRLYKLKLNLSPLKFSASVAGSVTLKSKNKLLKLPQVIDGEGLALIDGRFLISSEGDNDHKPRVPSQLMLFNMDGNLKALISLPEDMNPETSGPQRHGYQNNKALEGLSFDQKTDTLWTAFEAPLIQDLDVEGSANFIRILRVGGGREFLNKAEGEVNLPPHETLFYPLSPSDQTDLGPEVFKGVSEILVYEKYLFVMERGVRLSGTGWNHSVKVFAIDTSKAKFYKENQPPKGKIQFPEKKLIFDFEKKNSWGLGPVENFEGLCLGPMSEGQPSLFFLSDDNFSKHSRTQLVWVKMK